MSQKIGIFSILDSPALGGAESYLLSNLEFLSQQGFKISLATHNQEIKNKYFKKWNLINLPYRLDLIGNKKGVVKFFLQAPLAIIWLIRILTNLKKQHQQVIVYTPGFTERLIFSPFIKLLGLKLIWLEYGPVEAVFKRNFGLSKILYHATSFFPDHVITISKHSQQSMLNHSFINKTKTSIIYPGIPKISLAQLKTLQKKGHEWKRKHIIESKKTITFVGRLAIEKEVDILINAFSKLILKNVQLVIIGSGPEKKAYQKLTKHLKISNKVIFVDYVSETQKNIILSISDVFVFPSAWEMEGFGITTIEAMMVSVPVISTGAGPQKEIITNKKTGLFFKAHNSTDLSLRIKQLLSDKRLAQKLATNGRKKILAKFSQIEMLQKTLALIQSLSN
jgi:glycosyltransferase involved in cell wall biosynthesis